MILLKESFHRAMILSKESFIHSLIYLKRTATMAHIRRRPANTFFDERLEHHPVCNLSCSVHLYIKRTNTIHASLPEHVELN